MSTDDLTRRARERAFFLEDVCGDDHTSDLLTELVDTVDRLRASVAFASHEWGKSLEERDEWAAQWRGANDMFGAMRDERDEARAEADRFRTLWDRHGKNDLLAERDAARAALGRVRAWIDGSDKEIPANNDWGWGYEAAVDTARAAIEGKPS